MRCKQGGLWLMTLGFVMMGGFLLSQSRYPVLAPGQKVFVPKEFLIEWRKAGSRGTLNLTPDDLEALIYGVREIPGYAVFPTPATPIRPFGGVHTTIILDNPDGYLFPRPLSSVPDGICSFITRLWGPVDQVDEYLKGLREFRLLNRLNIHARVYDRPAKDYGLTLMEYRWMAQSGASMQEGTPSGFSLGEESWYLPTPKGSPQPEGGVIFVRLGRCFFTVESPDLFFSEALAWGIEYRILQHPKLLGMAKKPMTVLVGDQPVGQGEAIALAGVTVTPISSLSPAKVTLQTNRNKKEWVVTASLNGRWVKVKAFSWEMETEKGKVKLERPVFPYKGELVVPIRQVAEALGLRVEQRGQEIALRQR